MSLETLLEKYYTTAGRNTNMLIGVVVDERGLVPDVDVKRMKEFGDEIKIEFVDEGYELLLISEHENADSLSHKFTLKHFVIMLAIYFVFMILYSLLK